MVLKPCGLVKTTVISIFTACRKGIEDSNPNCQFPPEGSVCLVLGPSLKGVYHLMPLLEYSHMDLE